MICPQQKRQQLLATAASLAAVPPIAKRLASAGAEQGEADTKASLTCHNFEKGGPGKLGPLLSGVVHRPEGPAAPSMGRPEGQGGPWSGEDLDAFLASPKAYAAGPKMAFTGGRTLLNGSASSPSA